MKSILLLGWMLVGGAAMAQDWNPLGPVGVKRFFVNGDGYLRGMRVDSIRQHASGDSVFCLFRTLRGQLRTSSSQPPITNADSNGASWLGKKVIKRSDGTWLFDTWLNDTVVVNTRAALGQSWRFYDDSGSIWFNATVTGLDTQTVLDELDSVREITLSAMNNVGPVLSDSLHGWKIRLSKAHGFISVPDLYVWPYRRPNAGYSSANDFFLNLATNFYSPNNAGSVYGDFSRVRMLNFSLSEFHYPVDSTLYDWRNGDVFCRHFETNYTFNGRQLDSVLTRIPTAGGYMVTVKRYEWYRTSGPQGYVWNQNVYSPALFYGGGSPMPTYYMPEEYRNYTISQYLPNDSGFCKKSPRWNLVDDVFGSTTLPHTLALIYPKEHEYKEGLGQVRYMKYWGSILPTISGLLSWNMNGQLCGSPCVPLGASEAKREDQYIRIWPQPASDVLHIGAPADCLLEIYGVTGQKVSTTLLTANATETLDVRTFPAGLYIVRYSAEDGSHGIQKVLITR